MKAKLKVLKGPSAGKEIDIPVAKFFIGRGEDCHLRFQKVRQLAVITALSSFQMLKSIEKLWKQKWNVLKQQAD